MNPKRVIELLGRLAMLKYFPANNEFVLEGLLDLVSQMCRSEEQVEWLVKRMTSGVYAEWPGPAEMRACFCSRFPPKDGINAYSTVYPDGLPPSKPPKQLPPAAMKALPPGNVVSADDSLEASVQSLAFQKNMPSLFELDRRAKLRERAKAAAEMPPGVKPVTQDDIDKAVREMRDKKAKEAAGL